MEEFVASMNELPSNGIEKDLAKQAKINTDAFFNNYIDLAILASQKDDNDFAEIKSKYQHILTENEMNVLLLILNDYTTKEIAILLSKSEKGIEYSRKNIRLKLTIPKETSINQFVLEDLM
jgi:DNA-binding CsgD family transcriptional regulator